MSSELTVRPEGAMYDLVPAPHVAATTEMLRVALTNDSPAHPTISRLATGDERQRLNHRKNDLHSLLAPAAGSSAARDRIGKAVGNMLGGWLNNRAGENAQQVIAGWTLKLQELPAWAVIAACNDFAEGAATFEQDGKVHRLSPEYAPSQATVWRVAREKMDKQIAERDLIDRILRAKLAAPEIGEVESSKVGALLAGLAQNMGAKVAEEKSRDAEAARKASAEADARRAKFKADAEARRLARYRELGLRPVYRGDVLCDADALPSEYRFSVHEPPPSEAESILEAR